MHILSVKKICSCYVHLLNDWNYFWNKYCNLPFLAISHSLLPLLIFLASSWYQKAKSGLRTSLRYKKWLVIILKDFIKQPVIKQSPQFFFSHWLLHKSFFSFLIKTFAHFEKLIRFHWRGFIVYKNGENLEMLMEKFCQKLIVSNVILTFLGTVDKKLSNFLADFAC